MRTWSRVRDPDCDGRAVGWSWTFFQLPARKKVATLGARTAKSSTLINKTLALHGDTDCLPSRRYSCYAATHVHTYAYTRACTYIRAPFNPSFVRSFSCARRGCVQTCSWACCSTYTWDRHHRSFSLSPSTPSLLPLRAGEMRALQPNKGKLRPSPLYSAPLLPSSLLRTTPAVIFWSI